MDPSSNHLERPDVVAAIRGGDPEQPMEAEPDIAGSSHTEALFWRGVYREILTLEESVLARIRHLMLAQSETSKREVEISNVPVIVAQVERFRARLGFWEARLRVVEPAGDAAGR